MRTTFDNAMLAHVWAQQNQAEGRGSNFFFDGPSIYSYGRHFEIARFVTRKGKRAVLFTTRAYSISTSRHIGYARQALRGDLPVFHVADIDAAARGARDSATREDYKRRVAELELAAAKCRKSDNAVWTMNQAAALAHEANQYAEFFGRRWRIKTPEWSPEGLALLRAKAAKQAAQQKAQRAKAERKAAAEQAQARDDWRRGEGRQYPGGAIMLRLSADRERIETSRGAEIPASLAPLVWSLVQTARNISQPVTFEYPPRLGQFTLDRIEPDGSIIAGCHNIAYSELCGIARTLGYEGVQP
jgi:hypothetical protein